jgi:hypothetical protein
LDDMSKIVSITLSYDVDQDRIQLATQLDDKRAVRLWLTQRLARRLVSVLTANLEQAEAIPLPSVREAVMTQAQAQAVSTIRPRQPVVAPPREVPAYLVHNIKIRVGPKLIELQFESSLDIAPTAQLDRTLTRQWLTMLHRQFVAGQWPVDVWPVWLIEGSAQPAATGATRH